LSNIRVTYSGLISFIFGLVTVFVGLFFVIIVTRKLSPDEFGTWSLIGVIIGYFLISERVISYWTTRQIARDEQVGKTSFTSSSIFSFAAIPPYLALVYFLSQQSNAELEPMILGGALIFVFFIYENLHSINLAHKPHATSYGLFILETVKIPTALIFVFFMDLDVTGVILSVLISYVIGIIVQFYFARKKIQGKFNLNILKRWLKLSWMSLYSNIAKFFKSTDVIVYTIITGSVIGIAYYTAGMMIAKIIHHSDNISKPLYAKLLAKGSFDYIPETIGLQMFFAIPLLGIAIIFSKPAMFILNPEYLEVYVITIILAFRVFFAELNGAFGKILQGIDTVDVEKSIKFTSFLKSKIFFVHTIKNIHTGIQLITVIVLLLILHSFGFNELELVIWWALASLIIEIPFVIHLGIHVRKHVQFKFPIIRISKYIAATFAFVFVFFITSDLIITYQISIYDFLPGVILQFILCVGIYIGISYIIDNKTRSLIKSILSEIYSR